MRTLILDTTLYGHHLEYLHHIYMKILSDAEHEYIFAIPRQQWDELNVKLKWPEATNISFQFLNDEDCATADSGNMLVRCWKNSKLAAKVLRETKAQKLILISLAQYIPFLPFMMPPKTTLRGIIYKIYLRSAKNWATLIIDKLRYTVLARSKNVETVFILNDPRSALQLCKSYSSKKFVSCPDPVPDVDNSSIKDIRQSLNISKSDVVYLHFGAMDKRKGTLEIIEAVNMLSLDELTKRTFVFAGRIKEAISSDFYSIVELIRNKGGKIIVKDEFVSYAELNNLCFSCDCILIPYLLTDLSSGALGYAAAYNKPVIGPSMGLIGDLIRDNSLGITLETISPESILYALRQDIKPILSDYASHNSVDEFSNTILC